MDALQQDFGGFNPSFLGVSISIGSRPTLELLMDDWNDRGLTADELPRLPPADAFAATATLSVLPHEIRHFHDYLVSPIGSLTFWTRLLAFMDANQLIIVLVQEHRERPYNCLPVPLTRWLHRAPDERASLLASWNRVLVQQGRDALVVPKLAEVVLEATRVTGGSNLDASPPESYQLTRWVDAVDRRYERLRRMSSSMREVQDRLITPAHVFEASAIFVQTQELHSAYGSDWVTVFLDGIGLGRQRSVYTDVIDLLTGTLRARHGRDLTAEQLSAVVQWCMLGDPLALSNGSQESDDTIDATSAAARFARLWDHLRDHGLPQAGPPDAPSVSDWFSEWDRLVGDGVSSLENLRASLRRDERQLAHLVGLFENHRRSGGHLLPDADNVIVVARQFVDARRWCVQRYLEDPDRYVAPRRYLRSLAALERAPVKLVFNGDVTMGGPLVKEVYVAMTDADGRAVPIVVEPAFKMSGVGHITPAVAYHTYTLFTMADVLYSEFGRDRIDQHEYLMVRQAMFKGEPRVRLVNA